MPYWIGLDEAGYGPNLGPLTISATVWWAEDAAAGDDFYDRLAAVIAPDTRSARDRVAIADSKLLYSPGAGLAALERGLLPMLGLDGDPPQDWQSLWNVLGADPQSRRDLEPWYAGYDEPLPVAMSRDEIPRLIGLLRDGLAAAGVELRTIRTRGVFPEEFNRRVEEYGTKGAALSRATLELLAEVIEPLGDGPLGSGPIHVVCDKHGGRNRYQELLQRAFPEWLVEVRGESRAESRYAFGPPERRVQVAFRTGGEAFLPAALASMACKYLRELAMRAFNAYWQREIPDLRATAGYPEDAKRFRLDIAGAQKRLAIDDRILWRNR